MSSGVQPAFRICSLELFVSLGIYFHGLFYIPQYIMSSCGAIPGGDPRLRWISFCWFLYSLFSSMKLAQVSTLYSELGS